MVASVIYIITCFTVKHGCWGTVTITLSRMNFSGYAGRVNIFSCMSAVLSHYALHEVCERHAVTREKKKNRLMRACAYNAGKRNYKLCECSFHALGPCLSDSRHCWVRLLQHMTMTLHRMTCISIFTCRHFVVQLFLCGDITIENWKPLFLDGCAIVI